MDISTYLDQTIKIDAEWRGEGFSFTCFVNRFSVEFMEWLQTAKNNPTDLAKALSSVISEWTIVFKGEEFPPTFENLKILGVEFMNYLLDKVMEMTRGNAPAPKPSANGSAVKAE